MKGMLTNPETGDLLVEDGTIRTGNNDEYIAECVLRANRGEYKEYPLLGAEMVRLSHGEGDLLWCAEAKDMLQACGVQVSKVKIVENEIKLEA